MSASPPTDSAPGGFIHLSRAWYADATLRTSSYVDEVTIGDYMPDEDGGVGELGEFVIRWHDLDRHPRPPVPQLCMFNDAWRWLGHPALRPFFQWLIERHGKATSPQEVCGKLTELGFRDDTKEDR